MKQTLNDKSLIIRNTTINDIHSIANLQKNSFHDLDESDIWHEEHLKTHLKIFPEGQFCAEIDNHVVGSCTSFLVTLEPKFKTHTWIEICGDFYLKNHNPHGDTLYDADISVDPKFQRLGIASKMNEQRKVLAQKLNLKRILSGSRMYNFCNYSHIMNPEEYVKKVISGNIIDPILLFHLSNGFQIIKILPNYLNDPRSENYGVLVEWSNPEFTFQ